MRAAELRRAVTGRWHRLDGYAAAPWSTNFTGPNYTIGIEEELMILDAESLELVNAIESLLEASRRGARSSPS